MNPALYVTWKYGDINVLSATRMIPWKKKKRHNPLLQWFITLLSDNENNIDKNQLKKRTLGQYTNKSTQAFNIIATTI